MTRALETPKDAISWHSQIAADFDKKYSNSKIFQERHAVWTEMIDKYSNSSYLALDLGCGSGIFTFYLGERNREVIGLDGSAAMLEICRRKKDTTSARNVAFIRGDIAAIEHALNAKQDMIICSSVLEYLDDLDRSLLAISRTIKPQGLLLFSMPNQQSIYRKFERISFQLFGRPAYYEYVRNVCTANSIEHKLNRLGFEILEYKYYAETPLLSMLFHQAGLSCYSDNLFMVVAKLSREPLPQGTPQDRGQDCPPPHHQH